MTYKELSLACHFAGKGLEENSFCKASITSLIDSSSTNTGPEVLLQKTGSDTAFKTLIFGNRVKKH